MTLLRALLVLFAAGVVWWLLEWREHPSARSWALLEEVRALRVAESPDHGRALLRLDQGIENARRDYDDALRAELQRERLLWLEDRWRAALEGPTAGLDPADLEQVVDGAREWLAEFDGGERELLLLGARCASTLARPDEVVEFLERAAREDDTDPEVTAALALAHGDLQGSRRRALWRSLAGTLPEDTARETLAQATRIAALEPDAPDRLARLEALGESLPEEQLESLLVALDGITAAWEDAVRWALHTLELQPDGRCVALLMAWLDAAGAPGPALELGELALERRGLTHPSAVEHAAVSAMLALGRAGAAARRVRDRLADAERPFEVAHLGDEALLSWCRIVHGLERWGPLSRAATELQRRIARSGDPEHLFGLGAFYAGLARAEQGKLGSAGTVLSRVAPEALGDVEVQRGLTLELEYARARAAQAAGNARPRTESLRRATEAAPRTFGTDRVEARLRRIAGAAWLERGRLELEAGEARSAEVALTHALRLLPERRGEIETDWERAGREAMRRRGHPSEWITDSPARRRSDGTFPAMGPWEACARAASILAGGRPFDVKALLLPVLQEYPGLGPALELRARNELALGRSAAAVVLLLDLAEAGDRSPGVRRTLRELPPEVFTSEALGAERPGALRRWMRLEPRHAAFVPVVRELGRLRDEATLVALLEGESPSAHRAEARLVAAQQAARIERHALALRWLEALPPGTGWLAEHAALALRAALHLEADQPGTLEHWTRRLAHEGPLADPKLPGLLTRFLVLDDETTVRALLELPVTPTLRGHTLLAEAVLAGREGRQAHALELLERAEPLLDDDLVPRARALLALHARGAARERERGAERGDARDVERAARALLESESPPLRRALWAVAAGDPFAAARILDAIPLGAKHLPPWFHVATHLVLEAVPRPLADDGGEERARFLQGPDAPWARLPLARVLPILLAAETPELRPWALAWLAELPEAVRHTPAAALLEARLLSGVGERARAEARLEPWCLPGDHAGVWFERERIAVARLGQAPPSAAPALERSLWLTRRARVATLGARGSPPAVLARLAAWRAEPEAACRIYAQARLAEPNDPELARLLGEASLEAGRFLDALETLEPLLAERPELVPSWLAALERAEASGLLSTDEALERALAAGQRRPGDPGLLRARLERELRLARGLDERAFARKRRAILARLERYLARDDPRAIETLRSGESARWLALIERLDPGRAEVFVERELERAPGNPALWLQWSRALRARGRAGEARDTLRALAGLVPAMALRAEAARLHLELEGTQEARAALEALPLPAEPRARVERLLVRLEDPASTDAVAQPAPLEEALALWKERLGLDLPRGTTARRLARALARRDAGNRAHEALRILEEAHAELADRRELRAVLGARHLLRHGGA